MYALVSGFVVFTTLFALLALYVFWENMRDAAPAVHKTKKAPVAPPSVAPPLV